MLLARFLDRIQNTETILNVRTQNQDWKLVNFCLFVLVTVNVNKSVE